MLVMQLATCNFSSDNQCIFQNNDIFTQVFVQDKYSDSLESYFNAWKISQKNLGNLSNIKVLGEEAKQIVEFFDDRYKIITLTKHQDKVYEIDLLGNKNNADSISKLSNQILSTFQFLN